MKVLSAKRTKVEVTFRVEFDSTGSSPIDAIAACDIKPGHSFTDANGAVLTCVTMTGTPVLQQADLGGHGLPIAIMYWDVTATYNAEANDKAEPTEQPTTEP